MRRELGIIIHGSLSNTFIHAVQVFMSLFLPFIPDSFTSHMSFVYMISTHRVIKFMNYHFMNVVHKVEAGWQNPVIMISFNHVSAHKVDSFDLLAFLRRRLGWWQTCEIQKKIDWPKKKKWRKLGTLPLPEAIAPEQSHSELLARFQKPWLVSKCYL